MGNAEERPRTSDRQKYGCNGMRAEPVNPVPPLSFVVGTTTSKFQTDYKSYTETITSDSTELLERAGINLPPPAVSMPDEKEARKSAPLDTLAQLTPVRKNLQKRARSKYITNALAMKLADLNSPLRQSYWNSYHCCESLQQTGQTIVGKYCNNRWCLTCNRIRTAKMIIGYDESLRRLTSRRLLTLTVPNCNAESLLDTIEKMQTTIRMIQKSLLKRKSLPIKIVGLRKLEITYNPKRNDFHPHFHIVLSDDSDVCKIVIDEWLRRFPEANRSAQDERPCDDSTTMELFKYVTKIVTKNRLYVSALDTIFKATYRKRTFQPMGLKKDVSEDVEEIQSIIYSDLIPAEATWTWFDEATDWIDQGSGETLTGYTPSEAIKKLINDC